ncbi:hypothetical protein KAR91_53550 [Candidatus Pacearchaeota archaeon]|nr:hypothetical protein [Candidatus Pacearchaeota archaeon]
MNECKCEKCDYKWLPRVENPKACPNCTSRLWNVKRDKKAKEAQNKEGDEILFFKGDTLVSGIIKNIHEHNVIVRHAKSNYSLHHIDIYKNVTQTKKTTKEALDG